MSTERSSKGRSFHADGPTIEKALRCIIAKRARGTKNSPPHSRTQHPMCSQNRHWAAEDAEVRGGAAKDTTGDHCSDAILYRITAFVTEVSILKEDLMMTMMMITCTLKWFQIVFSNCLCGCNINLLMTSM